MKMVITLTPKVHVVMFHFAEFYLLKGQGLGPWSEQKNEKVYHDFKKT